MEPEVIEGEVIEQPGAAVATMPQQRMDVMTPAAVRDQVNTIQKIMKEVMKEGEHYGKIPGCGDKPSLLLPGAEKLSLAFRLAPEYRVRVHNLDGGHREYDVSCRLLHAPSGNFVAAGEGTCSTLEGKYRFRVAPKTLTNKLVPRDYWDARKSDPKRAQQLLGGPGFGTKKGDDGQWYITEGSNEKVEHDNPADYYNTVKKMACKRALVHAIRTATAAGDIFTQDIEDAPELYGGHAESHRPAAQQQPSQTQSNPPASTNQQPTQPAQLTNPASVIIREVETYNGTSKGSGKPFTIYTIHDTQGHKFKTFSETDANTAQQILDDLGGPATIGWSSGQHGYNLESIESHADQGGGTDAQPAQIIDPWASTQLPKPPDNGTGLQAEVVILSYEKRKAGETTIWSIETNKGRCGTISELAGEIAESVAGTGEVVSITYQYDKRGPKVVSIASSSGGDTPGTVTTNEDDVPF